MKNLVCVLLGAGLCWLAEGVTLSHGSTPIRVLLDRGSREALVRAPGGSLLVKRSPDGEWKRVGREATLAVRDGLGPARLALNGTELGNGALYVRGGPGASDPFVYDGTSYHGSLKVVLKGTELVLANVLPLDDYLVGTVAAEMSPEWETEALKAQAVASRTYAYYMMENPKSRLYDLDNSVLDQVYAGSRRAPARVRDAVRATAGEYLAAGDGRAMKAFFHARCGGTTETANAVWNGRGDDPQRSVPCPFCRKKPFTWRAAIPVDELLRALRLPATVASFQLFPGAMSASGRLTSLRVEADGKRRDVSSERLRGLLGYTKLKSTLFGWVVKEGEVRFKGTGMGHGVGMCQWGARHLAKQGRTYREILAHYYPGSQLRTLPPERALASD